MMISSNIMKINTIQISLPSKHSVQKLKVRLRQVLVMAVL